MVKSVSIVYAWFCGWRLLAPERRLLYEDGDRERRFVDFRRLRSFFICSWSFVGSQVLKASISI